MTPNLLVPFINVLLIHTILLNSNSLPKYGKIRNVIMDNTRFRFENLGIDGIRQCAKYLYKTLP